MKIKSTQNDTISHWVRLTNHLFALTLSPTKWGKIFPTQWHYVIDILELIIKRVKIFSALHFMARYLIL